MDWEGLTPPYSTIVADPPWAQRSGGPKSRYGVTGYPVSTLPYSTMSLDELRALPVSDIADSAAHLYLWTTNEFVEKAFDVARRWQFTPRQLLTWCKAPKGLGPGGAFVTSSEFVLFCRRGVLAPKERGRSTWFEWQRGQHSTKPPPFFDLVERVSPGPYVELFARAPRFGWDSWGHGYESRPA